MASVPEGRARKPWRFDGAPETEVLNVGHVGKSARTYLKVEVFESIDRSLDDVLKPKKSI